MTRFWRKLQTVTFWLELFGLMIAEQTNSRIILKRNNNLEGFPLNGQICSETRLEEWLEIWIWLLQKTLTLSWWPEDLRQRIWNDCQLTIFGLDWTLFFGFCEDQNPTKLFRWWRKCAKGFFFSFFQFFLNVQKMSQNCILMLLIVGVCCYLQGQFGSERFLLKLSHLSIFISILIYICCRQSGANVHLLSALCTKSRILSPSFDREMGAHSTVASSNVKARAPKRIGWRFEPFARLLQLWRSNSRGKFERFDWLTIKFGSPHYFGSDTLETKKVVFRLN